MKNPLPDRRFKIGTTSFIYPDHIIPNVQKLGRMFDEIELLIFESDPPDVLPTRQEIEVLENLSRSLPVSYNVHLPVDVCLTHRREPVRRQGTDRTREVIDLCSRLNPSTYTLHLDYTEPDHLPDTITAWKDRAFQSMDQLVSSGIPPRTISIETLDYPFEYLDEIIESLGLSVCLDIGHVIKYGFDLEALFEKHRDRIEIIHLHGVAASINGIKDHISLDRLCENQIKRIWSLLEKFDRTVSIEVFNKTNLDGSMKTLGRFFKNLPLLEKVS